ncbi:MAG: MATE family efflux transporter, partial [Bacteroidota bacterium]
MSNSKELGTEPIPKVLAKMAIPASVGFLIMNIYFIVDTIFVGRWVGPLGIAAITVVMPISFLVSSIGMAIGVGGASVISRALGADDENHACRTFGNMVSLTVILVFLLMILGFVFEHSILEAFGAKGDIFPYAETYFEIILMGTPFLAWAMMSNNVMRAEGEPNMAMLVMMIPAVVNLILDPIFIVWFEWGIAGAAWATAISYVMSAFFSLWFFTSGRSELKIFWSSLKLKLSLIKEISSIGSVTLARQGTISLLSIVLNQSLFTYG